MKRSADSEAQNSSQVKTSRSSSPPSHSHMACAHLSEAFASINPPRPSQQVHRDECTLCFDDQDGTHGIDVCLMCFNGGCTGNGDRDHSLLHFQKTGHSIVVNVKRRRKPQKPKPIDQAPQKLAIAAESEQDQYDWITTPKCLACDGAQGGKELPRTEKLESVITAMMKALSSSQQSEVKAWEEEIIPCNHTRELKQLGEPFKLEGNGLAECKECDLTSNLWLCLTCGNLGCGRAQFGGVGGNSHGLTHFEQSGHPVSVKQGTITAEGTADIYCYACNDARIDPNLAQHLRHFGMNVMDLSKTEKSMTELQLEQNLKFDFNMTGEDGKELEPLFGPGLTGLKNLGNSCYLASTLQSLFSFPAFQTRYADAYRPHVANCTNALPASCLECQLGKLADGLLSGRYSVPRAADEQTSESQKEGQQGPIFQAGIKPAMFKSLIGKGHEEFATMRQQDADEFFKHMVDAIQKDSRRLTSEGSTRGAPTIDPTTIFSYGLQQKLQCTECNRVRYTVEAQDAGLSLPVPIRVREKAPTSKGKTAVEGVHAAEESDLTAADAAKVDASDDKVEYEAVTLEECLDIFTAPESLEYDCPQCQKKVTATKQTLFTSFPDVLAVQVRRFQLINWVPQKVDVPILAPLSSSLVLDKYLGHGKREDEIELPEDAAKKDDAESSGVQFDAAAVSQLTSMGFPEVRAQRALLATGNTGDAEAAMEWLFAHMDDPDIDAPLDLSKGSNSSVGSNSTGPDTSALEEMGFNANQSRKALRLNSNNPEMAVAWLFENGDDAGESLEEYTAATSGVSSGEPSAGSKSTIGGSSSLPAQYNLKTFISHKGPSVHSGHYVSHVKKATQEGEEWVFFNDEKVVKAPLSSLNKEGQVIGVEGLSRLAYVYFFERQ
ncbi:unnamed protein product [Sympodiomycopsis kandeliae]